MRFQIKIRGNWGRCWQIGLTMYSKDGWLLVVGERDGIFLQRSFGNDYGPGRQAENGEEGLSGQADSGHRI